MKLYHYTAADHAAAIVDRNEGITLGSLTTPAGILSRFVIWLTTSLDWDQGWNTRLLRPPCDRAEVRLTVVIPKTARDDLNTWDELVEEMVEWPASFVEAYVSVGGRDPAQADDWRLFFRPIPRGWIRRVENRPNTSRKVEAAPAHAH